MTDKSSAGLRNLLRRWFPCPGTALALTGLGVLIWLFRKAVFSPRLLSRAVERFAASRGDTGMAETPSFRWDDAAVLGTHYSTLAALGLVILALLTLRWWCPPRPVVSAPVPKVRFPRWFRAGLIAAVLLAAGLRAPLATGSLWWDELWNVKYATVGEWRPDPADAGEVRFVPSSWSRAAWYYNKPTNHPVLTLPSKLGHLTWQRLTGAADGQFSEWVIRLPVLLGGLAALLLTAWTAARLAGPRAGMTAAVLIAIHPWLIRYGVDARSYGLAVFFTAAAIYSLLRATERNCQGRNGWWWVFGLCQFLLMWAHVVSHLPLCAALFGSALWLILTSGSPAKKQLALQLLVINALAAGLLIMAFLPNLLQVPTWGGRNDDGNLLTGSYLFRTLCQIAAGMAPPGTAAGDGIPSLSWAGLVPLLAGGLAAAATGLRHLWRTHRQAAVVLLSLLACTALFLLIIHLTGWFFYHRFIIACSVPLILLISIGLSRLRSPILTAAALAGFALITFPQTRLLLSRSYAPFREMVADMQSDARSRKGVPLTVCYGLGSHVMQSYDPALRDIRKDPAAALESLIAEARGEDRPLYVAYGYEALNRLNQPDGFPILDNPALFEKISTRHGIEPEFTFHLLRLKDAVP